MILLFFSISQVRHSTYPTKRPSYSVVLVFMKGREREEREENQYFVMYRVCFFTGKFTCKKIPVKLPVDLPVAI